MPKDKADTPLVLQKVNDRFSHILGEASIRDLPYFDEAVFWGRGYDVVIVRTPSNVKNWTFVAAYEWYFGIDPADLFERKNEERAAASGLDNDGQKFRVDWAEGWVPGGLWDADVVVALLSLRVRSEDVAELALTDDAERHSRFLLCRTSYSGKRQLLFCQMFLESGKRQHWWHWNVEKSKKWVNMIAEYLLTV